MGKEFDTKNLRGLCDQAVPASILGALCALPKALDEIEKLQWEKEMLVNALSEIKKKAQEYDFIPEDESEDFLNEIWSAAHHALAEVR